MIEYKFLMALGGKAYPTSLPLPDPKKTPEEQRGKFSYYALPMTKVPQGNAGNTRRWGDAPPEVQKKVIDTIISKSTGYGLSTRETAHVLAIAYVESGFNPDAAAGTTSASGVGQFIYDTGKSYGLTYAIFSKEPNQFDYSK